jgi:hypothetical protein
MGQHGGVGVRPVSLAQDDCAAADDQSISDQRREVQMFFEPAFSSSLHLWVVVCG